MRDLVQPNRIRFELPLCSNCSRKMEAMQEREKRGKPVAWITANIQHRFMIQKRLPNGYSGDAIG